MDHRLIQPASRDQIVAIIRQRAERANLQRDLPAHLGQVSRSQWADNLYFSIFWGSQLCKFQGKSCIHIHGICPPITTQSHMLCVIR